MLRAVLGQVKSVLQAGTAVLGKVGIDQTTPGTTNNVTLTDTVAAVTTGSLSSIGASALQLTSTSIAATKGVLVKASDSNGGIVYVGPSTVTAATTAATDGIPLAAGESVLIPVSNANVLYCIGSTTGLKVFFAAC